MMILISLLFGVLVVLGIGLTTTGSLKLTLKFIREDTSLLLLSIAMVAAVAAVLHDTIELLSFFF